MGKTLEHSQIDLMDRRKVEAAVTRYRGGTMSYHEIVRTLTGLGFDRGSVVGYVALVDSTLDGGRRPEPRRMPDRPPGAGYFRWY